MPSSEKRFCKSYFIVKKSRQFLKIASQFAQQNVICFLRNLFRIFIPVTPLNKGFATIRKRNFEIGGILSWERLHHEWFYFLLFGRRQKQKQRFQIMFFWNFYILINKQALQSAFRWKRGVCHQGNNFPNVHGTIAIFFGDWLANRIGQFEKCLWFEKCGTSLITSKLHDLTLEAMTANH